MCGRWPANAGAAGAVGGGAGVRRRLVGGGGGRWTGHDQVLLEADAPRVRCPEHGVVVAAVPWARHGAGHTRAFDEQVAWLAVACSKTAVTELMRIAWRTVGAIITRVWADVERARSTGSTGCGGSGSTRSPTSAATAT